MLRQVHKWTTIASWSVKVWTHLSVLSIPLMILLYIGNISSWANCQIDSLSFIVSYLHLAWIELTKPDAWLKTLNYIYLTYGSPNLLSFRFLKLFQLKAFRATNLARAPLRFNMKDGSQITFSTVRMKAEWKNYEIHWNWIGTKN